MGTTVTANYAFVKPNEFEETDNWADEVNGNMDSIDTLLKSHADSIALKANAANAALTGNPTAPTPAPGDNDTSIATTAFVKAAIDVVLGGVGAAFDTLSEIATELGLKAYANNAVLTGNPTAPTPAPGDNDTSISTTAFVAAAILAALNNAALTGNPTAPTAAPGDSDTSIASTAFVAAAIAALGGADVLADAVSITGASSKIFDNTVITKAYKRIDVILVGVSTSNGAGAGFSFDLSGDNGSNWVSCGEFCTDTTTAAQTKDAVIEILNASVLTGTRMTRTNIDTGQFQTNSVLTGYINAIRIKTDNGSLDGSGKATIIGYR